MNEESGQNGISRQVGSLRIPEKNGLPEPAFQFPSDVVFLMSSWYAPFLSYPHKSIQGLFEMLAPHLKGHKEQESFKKEYNSFQLIRSSKSFFTNIDEMIELFFVLSPKIIVFYKLLFGNYSDSHSGMSRVYKDITANSAYSRMPQLEKLAEPLGHQLSIVLTHGAQNSIGNTHMLTAEQMMIKKVKSEYPDVKIVGTRDIVSVARYVNRLLG